MKIYSILLALLLVYAISVFALAMVYFNFSAETALNSIGFSTFQVSEQDLLFHYSLDEQKLLSYGLVDVQSLNPTIKVELVYATESNFIGRKLYSNIRKAFLIPVIAEKLSQVQTYLETINPNYSLVVLDAARPDSVQKVIWDWAVTHDKQRYIASPILGDIHSFGCAVDVTIMRNDTLLDMGTDYDYLGPEAEPRNNWKFLQDGTLSQQQITNRIVLKDAMLKGGFQSIQSEWWHFNGVSNGYARSHFRRIE